MNEDNFQSYLLDTPRKTPKQSRPYLSMPNGVGHYHHHQTPHGLDLQRQLNPETNSVASLGDGIIYGTNVSTQKVTRQLERFIHQFQDFHNIDGQLISQKIYRRKFMDLDIMQSTSFNVKGTHIAQYSRQLYYQFLYFPAEMISCFDDLLKRLFQKHFINCLQQQESINQKRNKRDRLMVGITDLNNLGQLRSLAPKDINRLISFRGIVIRCSQIYPQMKRAVFRCQVCKLQAQVDLENAKVRQPYRCHSCKRTETMQIVHNLCQFTDKQYIKFQQLPQKIPQGQTPNSITLICYDTNVDGMRPGDKVQIIGIYRAQSSRISKNKRVIKSVFTTYVDLISYNVVEDNRYKSALGNVSTQFTDNQKQQFMEMASKETIIDDLIKSFAPSIYGHQDIKKGILTQIFGGANKNFSENGRGRFRSDINICLVGDPSTAKSQLLQQVNRIASRGIYTSGRGSSAVGLTANVRKDPQTKQFVLQSGALVLSDLGVCCIDQFDKMDRNNRTILLQAMQQQTISIAKAGIVCQLNSRTSILAAANPVNSRYNPKKSVVQNINLQPALLSRFDLIYILLDSVDMVKDKKLAMHILELYSGKKIQQISTAIYPLQILSKYITYARQFCTPILTEQASQRIIKFYCAMRKQGNANHVITATPRQLESMIRISQAFSKMRLSNRVQLQDAQMAFDLINSALKKAATDPQTGLINMDIIATGKSLNKTKKIQLIYKLSIQTFSRNQPKYTKSYVRAAELKDDLLKFHIAELQSIDDSQLQQALKKLQGDDHIALLCSYKKKIRFRVSTTFSE